MVWLEETGHTKGHNTVIIVTETNIVKCEAKIRELEIKYLASYVSVSMADLFCNEQLGHL